MRRGNRTGFTILEAAIAVVIVSMSAVGVLRAFSAQLSGAERTRDQLEALALAQSALAQLRLANPAELASLPDSLAKGAFAAPLGQFHWLATSSVVPGVLDLYDLYVTVEGGRAKVELRTRAYRPVPRAAIQ